MRHAKSKRRRWAFETLEDRTAPATLTVNTSADDTASDAFLSLREALALVSTSGDASYGLGRSLSAAEAAQVSGVFGANDTIQFAGVTSITLATEQLTVWMTVAINGPASGLTLRGSGNRRLMEVVASNATLSIANLTLTNGYTTGSGGAILLDGSLNATNCTFANNTAGKGGAIFQKSVNVAPGSTVNVVGCTFTNNTATDRGGALYVDSFTGYASASLANSTISGNLATTEGAGIFNNAGSLTMTNCTVTGNRVAPTATVLFATGSGSGGGIFAYGVDTLKNTIVAGNYVGSGSVADDIGSVVETASNTLVGNALSRGLIANGVNGNLVGIGGTGTRPIASILNPTLADNLGPTKTHALVAGSVAVDAGANASVPVGTVTDQRGAPFARIAGAAVDLGAVEDQHAFVVDTLSDVDDSNYSVGNLSLREAVKLANANPGADAISFAPSLTASGPATITLGAPLVIRESLAVNGPGASLLRVSGNNQVRVFTVNDGSIGVLQTVSLNALTIADGRDASDNGAGVQNSEILTLNDVAVTGNVGTGIANFNAGELTLNASVVSGNSAFFSGGGIGNVASGPVTVNRSLISGNVATLHGGGIYAKGNSFVVTNSTISGNTAGADGGGISHLLGSLTIVNTTIVGNRADSDGTGDGTGGGLRSAVGSLLQNTIVAGNVVGLGTTPSDLSGEAVGATSTNNLVGDAATAGGLTNGANGNLVGLDGTSTRPIDAILNTTLADNGGPTKTHALVAGSVAINAGANGAVAGVVTDQRGAPFARIVGAAVDLGAVEDQHAFVVDTLSDVDDSNYSAGNLSLREAIKLANANPGADAISFAPSLTAAGPATITLGAPLVVTESLAVNGPGASLLSISGNDQVRVFTVNDGNSAVQQAVALNGITVTRGYDATFGAGISNTEDLTLTNSIITKNVGQGVSNNGAGTLTLDGVTVSENSGSQGGGVFSSSSKAVTLVNATVTGNSATTSGGGVFVTGGSLVVTNSTIANNTASSGGGIFAYGAVSLTGATIANNVASSAASSGGGVHVRGAFTVVGSTISGNVVGGSGNSFGGGVYVQAGLTGNAFSVTGSTIANNATNATSNNYGGGVYLYDGTLNLADSTVSNNALRGGAGFGGGLYVFNGTVAISGSTVASNRADQAAGASGFGGGIYVNLGVLSVVASTVANNLSNQSGGGIVVGSASSGAVNATIDRSTISGNVVGAGFTKGGGVVNFGSLTITNSTLSGNQSGNHAGGIANEAGSLTIVNSTITGNRADSDGVNGGVAGGLRAFGTVILNNTIVAGNLVGTGTSADDLGGTVNAASSYNLIGAAATAGGLTNGANGNLVGLGGSGTWPVGTILNPTLADNGGPTKTHALVAGSPAINAGNDANLPAGATTDQRGAGFARIRIAVDLGAVEFDPSTVRANQILGRAADGSWWFTSGVPGSAVNVAGPVWSNAVTWTDVISVDLTGDGLQELVGRVQESGEWWVSSPNSAGVFTTAKWATWNPSVNWVDVRFADLDADGRADVIARVRQSGEWWVGKSNGVRFVTQLWDTWNPNVTWVDVTVVDLDADNRSDILARVRESGDWWVTTSAGTVKGATTKWASWSPAVTWVDVRTGDLDGDGRTDLIARVKESGEWWAGKSTGAGFVTSKWTTWNPNVTWVDVRLADLTGDGRADLVARVFETAEWWVTKTSTASTGATSRWADWSESVTWRDVLVADFDGDGKQDLAARELSGGDWWAALSNATNDGFVTRLFADWATVPWLDVHPARLRP